MPSSSFAPSPGPCGLEIEISRTGAFAVPRSDRRSWLSYWPLSTDKIAQKAGRAFPTIRGPLLFACINAVFGSWASERAVTYRGRHDCAGLKGPPSTSRRCSQRGLRHLLSRRIRPMLRGPIGWSSRASFGLGESVVSGDVDPDRFVVCRDNRAGGEVHRTQGQRVAAFGGASVGVRMSRA